MPSRTVLAASGLAVTIVFGLTACSSSNDTSTASSTTASTSASSTSMTEAENDATSTTAKGGSGSDSSSTTVDVDAAGGGSVTIVSEVDGEEQTLVMGFGTSDGDCTIDAATNIAEVDVATADQSFELRYDPAEPTDAAIEFTDTISSKSENISLYVDKDTEGSSVDDVQITTGRAAITAQISNTFASFPATITVSCP